MSDIPEKEQPSLIAQHYALLREAEAAETAEQRLDRRRFLRRSVLAVGGLVVVAGGAGALSMLYPTLAGQFGGTVDLGSKANFPAATPDRLKLNQAGVFYHETARAFIVHLARETHYLLLGSALTGQLTNEDFALDADGSCWLALYRRCTHLGTPVVFRNDCASFKCPSHGAHFHCDGEYLDGPAPRSMDRFPLSFNNDHLLVDTSQLVSGLGHDLDSRLLAPPSGPCMW